SSSSSSMTMGSSGGICFRTLVLLLVAYLGGMRAREAPLPLPSARSAGVNNRRAPERHGLSLDFYGKTCPSVDHIVANVTAERFRDHPATGPAVLRLFHNDCFVEGCDASILIAPSGKAAGEKVERDMEENRNLPQYGFDTVEMAKAAVESKCPGVVSCADILALAARDAVQLVRRRTLLRGEEGEKRQQGIPGWQGARQPAPRQLHRGRAPPRVRRQGPGRGRPGGAVRRAHHRLRALRPFPGPPLRLPRHPAAGPVHGRSAGEGAAHDVPLHRRQRPRGGAVRREHAVPVRPRLLRQPAGQAGRPGLRPGAVPGRAHQAARAGARRGQGPLLPGLRRQHGQDGLHPGQEGQEGRGQENL
uniref:Peroxidase n=1 Tax=Aegilops tauschii subsp. strangulata TaxID=200361 RepID=A0A453F7A6_AEGTS